MATKHHHTTEEEDDREERSTPPRTSRGGSRRRPVSGEAAAGLSAAAIYDIVERLGIVDMVVGRIKARLDEVDADKILDDVADYLKKNPEVLVVALGAVTLASGALVYLNRRK